MEPASRLAGKYGREIQQKTVDAVGGPPSLDPYLIFDLPLPSIFGGQSVRAW